jgi:NAD(P)-dependent dehydrogenase (short-subunit alcohol dehydrogenase family)
MKLYDRVAVITGGASGIGAAIAHRFRSEGANIALIDRDAEALDEVLRSLDGSEDAKMAAVSDVSDAAAARDGMSKVLARWGRIDILVTAAGISIGGTVASTDEISWDRVFAINVRGTFLWAREAIPYMATSGRGSIITLGSQLAISSGGANAAYIASKGAIVSLTRTMAVDHAKQGIRVNALMPGSIDTPMARRSLQRYADPQETAARWAKRHALGRLGKAEEVANAALFLASDDSSFTTGSLLFVDGGWTAM